MQILDIYMVMGIRLYKNAINIYGKNLLASKANLLIVNFISKILNIKELNLIIFIEN